MSEYANSIAEPSSPDVKVLSGTNAGEFSLGEEARNLVCLLSDGRLLVATGQELNAHVQSYMARLNRLGFIHTRQVVDIATIRLAYERGSPDAAKIDHTAMQAKAKQLLVTACRERASDIHIRIGKFATEVHFRIHNDLLRMSEHSKEYGERLLATIYGAMTDVSDSAYKPNERQDARIGDSDKLPEGLHGARIATTPTVDGRIMVLRLLYDDADVSNDMRKLGFSEQQVKLLNKMKESPVGMNIISGPTGSGKSTTLQRVLAGKIADSAGRIHVITVEDPPEYPIPGAVQTPVTNVKNEAERLAAFSEAISNAMRLDPDTIMIGEMRDFASAQLCLRAAMTGHQLWTTVHANNTIAIVDRLIDLGLSIAMVTDPTLLTGLVAQRLIKVLCQKCKLKLLDHINTLPPAALERTRHALNNQLEGVFIHGPGCTQCGGRGTTGRTVVAEVVVPDETFFQHIRLSEKVKARAYWLAQGGHSMLQHAIEKIAAGIVDPIMAEQVVGHLWDSDDIYGQAAAEAENSVASIDPT